MPRPTSARTPTAKHAIVEFDPRGIGGGQPVTRELGREAPLGAVDDLRRWMSRGRGVMPEITEDHLGAAQSVRVRYRALDLDLADAVNVALAADYDTDAILTLDRRDFRAVHPWGRYKAFWVLPDDRPSDAGPSAVKYPFPLRACVPPTMKQVQDGRPPSPGNSGLRARLRLICVKVKISAMLRRDGGALSRRACPLRAQPRSAGVLANRSNEAPYETSHGSLTWGLKKSG